MARRGGGVRQRSRCTSLSALQWATTQRWWPRCPRARSLRRVLQLLQRLALPQLAWQGVGEAGVGLRGGDRARARTRRAATQHSDGHVSQMASPTVTPMGCPGRGERGSASASTRAGGAHTPIAAPAPRAFMCDPSDAVGLPPMSIEGRFSRGANATRTLFEPPTPTLRTFSRVLGPSEVLGEIGGLAPAAEGDAMVIWGFRRSYARSYDRGFDVYASGAGVAGFWPKKCNAFYRERVQARR